MGEILEQAYQHKGAVFIEMLQNCPVFNDGVWEGVKDDPAGKQIALAEGKPLVFAGGTKGIRLGAGHASRRSSTSATARADAVRSCSCTREQRLDAVREPARAARAARLPDADGRALPRRTSRPTTQLANAQVDDAIAKQGQGDLDKLMYSGMVWEVGADGTRH